MLVTFVPCPYCCEYDGEYSTYTYIHIYVCVYMQIHALTRFFSNVQSSYL